MPSLCLVADLALLQRIVPRVLYLEHQGGLSTAELVTNCCSIPRSFSALCNQDICFQSHLACCYFAALSHDESLRLQKLQSNVARVDL